VGGCSIRRRCANAFHGFGFKRELRDQFGLDAGIAHTGEALEQGSDSFESQVDFLCGRHALNVNKVIF